MLSLEDIRGTFGLIEDHKVDNWFLMENYWLTLSICLGYLISVGLFCRWMKHREQFEIRGLMVAYNMLLVVLSIYLCLSLIYYGLQTGFSVSCWSVDTRINVATIGMASSFWLYYFSKIIELLDTMFFIARKRFHLVTLLHVYHHVSLPALSWLTVRYAPGGLMSITFIMNSFIHIFMYSYYALAAAGSQYQKYIWWKKYLTVMQMIQFVIMILHSIKVLSVECSYPRILVWLTLSNATIFLLLFMNYFLSTRNTSDKRRKEI